MSELGSMIQSADWKQEKHVPVIDIPGEVKAGTAFTVAVSVGKEIPHPNTTEHHIGWIELYFKPDGGKFAYQVGSYRFDAHGASTEGPNTGPVHSEPTVSATLTVASSGTLSALSFCNIHGLWESSAALTVA